MGLVTTIPTASRADKSLLIYTGRDLSREEHAELSAHASSIVIKGVNSPERLIDEASLFLHSVDAALPPEQQDIIRTLHDPEKVLRGRKAERGGRGSQARRAGRAGAPAAKYVVAGL